MLEQYFKEQIEAHPILTEDVLEKVEFKRVWSGQMMRVGDKVLYAFVIPKGETDPLIIQLLERELQNFDSMFTFVRFEKNTIPVLQFK